MFTKFLTVFFVSMLPLAELRVAVPLAVGMKLPLVASYIICIIGNMLPVPFIYFFARKVLEWGATKPLLEKPFTWILKKGEKGGEKLMAKVGRSTYVALFFCFLWESPCPEQVPGPEHWQPVFWIWILKRVYWQLWEECF